MLIKYLVPKDLICTHKTPQDPYPPDIAIKLLDQQRLYNQPAKAFKPSDIALSEVKDFDLTYFPKYLRSKADWLLRHLSKHGIRWNSTGEIFHNDQVVPGSHILELVNDALKERKRSDPLGWQLFAQILRDLNVPRGIIQNKKRIILTPSKIASDHRPRVQQTPPTHTPISRRIRLPGDLVGESNAESKDKNSEGDEEFVPAYEQLYPESNG